MPSLKAVMQDLYLRSLRGAPITPLAAFFLWIVFVLYHGTRLLKRGLYDFRILRRVRLGAPTISVGNPTMGGTGKTPLTAWLARTLAPEAGKVVVLSRGYRGEKGRWVEWVSRGGRLLSTPDRSGDEAYILARRLPGATVLSGSRRASTGRLAVATESPGLVILDDGQQYYRMERDLDVALLDLPLRASQMRLFPFGELREPILRLADSDLIVLSRVDQVNASQRDAACRFLDSIAPGVPRAFATYQLSALRELCSGEARPPDILRGKRILALCNVANPASFLKTVHSHAPRMVLPAVFPDHHRYGHDDEVTLLTLAVSQGIDTIVMTEKDEVNLPPWFRLPAPAFVLEVQMDVRGEGFNLVDFLETRVLGRPAEVHEQVQLIVG